MRALVSLQFFLMVVAGCFITAHHAHAVEKMTVRGGDHDGYSRLVFDWPKAPDYTLENSNGTLSLKFKTSGEFVADGLPSALRNIQGFKKTSGDNSSLTFSMVIPKDSKTRDFAIGDKIILDVYDGASPLGSASPPKVKAKIVGTKPDVKPDVVLEKQDDVKKQDFVVESLPKATAIPLGDVQEEPVKPAQIEDHVITLTTVTSLGLSAFMRHGDLWIVTDAPDVATPPVINGPHPEKFNAFEKIELSDGDVYRFDLPEGVTAYAEGGGVSWRIHLTQNENQGKGARTVSPQRESLDGRDTIKWPIKGLRKTIRYTDPVSGDEVVAITANAALETSGNVNRYVDFSTMKNIIGVAYAAKSDGVSSKIALDGVSIDKSKGLILLTQKDADAQIMRQEISQKLPLLVEDETKQNEKIESSKDSTIKEGEDLALTEKPPSAEKIEEIKKEIGYEEDVKVDVQPAPKIDVTDMSKATKQKPVGNNIYNFPKWELGGLKSLTSNMHALMAQVAAKDPVDQTEDIITMAKLLIANNRGVEALGMLRIAQAQVPELETTPEFESLQGAAFALSGKFDEAFSKLTSEKLKKYDDIKFWRSYTLAGLEDWKQAGELLPANVDFLKTYPSQVRYPLALAFAEIALRNGRNTQANEILEILKPDYDSLSLSYRSAWDYLSGVAKLQEGDTKMAESLWAPLVKNGKDDLYRAKAGLSLTRLQIDNKTLKPNEAIDRLEGLRYAWRGDELETLINYRLSQLYFDNKEYLKALTVLRNAMTMTPDLEIGQDVRKLMTKSFNDVFEKDLLSTMTPIEAISFYEEFKDLTPVGSAGDDYVEKLAERLVDAELLGRAASLLEGHINNRLTGAKKVDVAIRLAAIRLLDGNPDGALRSLEIAQNALDSLGNGTDEKSPQDIAPQAGEEKTPENKAEIKPDANAETKTKKVVSERQRQIYLLKARALSMQNKADEALLILETMRVDADVNKLRTDIAWVAGKWEQAAMALNDLILAEDISPTRTLNDYQRDIILNRAIALNLSGQRVALTNLRERFDDQMKNTPKGKMFDVVTRPRRPDLVGSREAIESMISEIDLFKGFLDDSLKTDKDNQPKDGVKAQTSSKDPKETSSHKP